MQLTLLCEQCKARHTETPVGVFDIEDLEWPLRPTIFRTPNPDLLPDPFPAVTEWEWARCRQCGARPFLNIIPQGNQKAMIVTGERVPMEKAGQILTLEHGYIPIPGWPGADLTKLERVKAKMAEKHIKKRQAAVGDQLETKTGFGTVVEQLPEVDKPDPSSGKEYGDGPVECPLCGKVYRTQARMDKFHRCKGA